MGSETEPRIAALQAHLRQGAPRLLEELTADLLSWLLDIQVVTSKSGFQHGGDAGTAGRQDRHLRAECKRYGDETPLSDRELQGEIKDAIRHNPSLEAWVLVSTRIVTETSREKLNLMADDTGVPVLVIDWTLSPQGLPDLAALCAGAPHLVERHYGAEAGKVAQSLAQEAMPCIERIRRELQPWRIGYDGLRQAAEQRLLSMWRSDGQARALFGQNVSGETAEHLVLRRAVLDKLQQWWIDERGHPLVAFGYEGVGKTWAVMHWLIRGLPRLPITLALPSSALPDLKGVSDASVEEFLARELRALTRTRTYEFWLQRLRRLLSRPATEGPVLLLLIDGLNQEPSFEWQRLLQVLQGATFAPKVRVLLTTQTHFLEDDLHGLRLLSKPAVRVGVEPYDVAPGGELEQLLSHHGLKPSDLPAELLKLARIPRLFPLVLKFRAEASLRGDATVSGLLWAYGRDELGMREGRAFSDAEWEVWLCEFAKKYRAQIAARQGQPHEPTAFSLAELSASAAQPHLEPKFNHRRLAEIIDGTWMVRVPGTAQFRPREETIVLALGVALLAHLEQVEPQRVDSELASWMDPIGATSMAVDILAAAASIVVAKYEHSQVAIASAILTALLQSQNATDAHRREIQSLAPAMAEPLMEVIERSCERAQASARQWAMEAIERLPATSVAAWEAIYERMVRWVARAECPSPAERARADESVKYRSARLKTRIGTDDAGVVTVLGVPLRLEYSLDEELGSAIPRLLQGRPLTPALRVLFAASIAAAVNPSSTNTWDGLHWLILLNQRDRVQTVEELEKLSTVTLGMTPEVHVHPDLRVRVAALLLWLAGTEDAEARASTMRSDSEGGFSYERDYLENPPRSLFEIERRHVAQLLADEGVALQTRIRRALTYLPDPALEASPDFVAPLSKISDTLDIAKLDTHLSHTLEDHQLEAYVVAAARFAPDALARLTRRRLRELAQRTAEARHWGSIRATEHLLLVGNDESAAARQVRLRPPEPPSNEEGFVTTRLLHLELLHASAAQQLDTLVQTSDTWLILSLLEVMQPTTPEVVVDFVQRWGFQHEHGVRVLLNYLAMHGTRLTASVFQGLIPWVLQEEIEELRTVGFIALATAAPEEFGRVLLARGWRAAPHQSIFEQSYGSAAVVAASQDQPLDALKDIVAPWSLLRAARERGGAPGDAKLAAAALDDLLAARRFETSEPGAQITVRAGDPSSRVSFSPAADTELRDDIERMKETFDMNRQVERQRQANERGAAYLNRARSAGARLYAMNIPVDDVRLLVQHCSAEVDAWLDGMDQVTEAFRRRVELAGGLLRALCEALLDADPLRGVQLWRALEKVARVRFIGLGGINELFHLPFRASESTAVLALREELYSVRRNPTDKDYLELIIAAAANGAEAWLSARIALDEQSSEDWRRKRAIVLRGMFDHPSADQLTWSAGAPVEGWAEVRRNAVRWRNSQALSRHWWRIFLSAATPEAAYAAWTVFLTSVDRRAWIWIDKEIAAHADGTALWRLKMLHYSLNRPALDRAVEHKEKYGTHRLDTYLMGWKSPRAWLNLSAIADG